MLYMQTLCKAFYLICTAIYDLMQAYTCFLKCAILETS